MKTSLLSCAVASLLLLALPPAQGQIVTVSGTVLNTFGVGIPGVQICFSGGVSFPIPPTTGLTGAFSVAVPVGTYNIDFLPATSAIAPRQLKNVLVLAPLSLGIITLQNGFTLSGTVTNSLAVGVFNANIDVFDMVNGGKLFTPNDITDVFGNYTVVVPAGIFRVRAKPANGILLVAQEIKNIVVNGPTIVPTFVLLPGVVLTGTVVLAGTLQPIAGVDFDGFDVVSGIKIVTPHDKTNSSGFFSVVMPLGTFRTTYEPPVGVLFVSREIDNVVITGNMSMGTIVLDPGFALSGTILGPAGPQADVDIDVDTLLGNIRLLTPGDKSDVNGNFTVVVPLGSFLVTYQPTFVQGLVATSVSPVVVNGTTSMAPVTLQAGVALTGIITSFDGFNPEVDANIDVVNPTSGFIIPTPADSTDATGHFQVIVPNASWNIRVKTPRLSLSQDQTYPGIVVAGPTTLNRTLPIVPVGAFLAPAGLPPQTPGASVPLTFGFFRPLPTSRLAALSLVIVDPAGVPFTLAGPVTITVPGQQLFLLSLPFPVFPINPIFSGLPFRYRFLIQDPVTGEEFDKHDIEFKIL